MIRSKTWPRPTNKHARESGHDSTDGIPRLQGQGVASCVPHGPRQAGDTGELDHLVGSILERGCRGVIAHHVGASFEREIRHVGACTSGGLCDQAFQRHGAGSCDGRAVQGGVRGSNKHEFVALVKPRDAGKDFAAPIGTPFFAAGSGTVVKAQYWSTWGNYVRIRHTSGYETEYAHASRIAPGIKAGVKVRQGQVIAYVGNTGRSTGPHLHFGVLYNNKRINPDRVKSLPSLKLFGRDLINFKNEVDRTDLYRSNISNQNLKLKK